MIIKIKIKYFDETIPKLQKIDKGNWIDLYTREDVTIKKGEQCLIPLNVAIKLPNNYEAIISPRSSTFSNFGLLQANSIGVVDTSYSGDNDEWKLSVVAYRNYVFIPKGTRLCQFRIQESQPCIELEIVNRLDSEDRNGFGSTGKGDITNAN